MGPGSSSLDGMTILFMVASEGQIQAFHHLDRGDTFEVDQTICHAPWLLIEADVLTGRRVTSYPSLATDLRNAGAEWVDEEVVVDHGLVTSRRPDDLPAFTTALVEEFARGSRGSRAFPPDPPVPVWAIRAPGAPTSGSPGPFG